VAMGGDGAQAVPGTAGRPLTARQAQQWLLTLVPTFPVLLLVLRLWHLSRQDMSTMLLLVQYVSPLGLLSALLISLVWVLPLAVLAIGLLGRLLWLSAPDRFDPERSLLARTTARMPGWVTAGAVLLAGVTWQMRFLPALLMIALALLGLYTRRRYADDPARIRMVCLAVPLLAAVLTYAWLGPAIAAAVRDGEGVTAVLLALPPGLAPFLTGPVPSRIAPPLIRGVTLATALAAPFVLGAIFLRAPILPAVAVELDADPGPPVAAATPADNSGRPVAAATPADNSGRPVATAVPGDEPDVPAGRGVLLGRVITVDDRMITLLDDQGSVRFVPNERVRSQALCPETAQVPYSAVAVHGWQVEETALEWLIPRRQPSVTDPRCIGRISETRETPLPEATGD
jgi:hypothetical protein